MKKAEKTDLTKKRIITSAIEEFGLNGYDNTTINSICNNHSIAKGLLYHNFKGKDEIFLACAAFHFKSLTNYLKENINMDYLEQEEQLKIYLKTRLNFFRLNPLHQRIFCDTIIFTPPHLRDEVTELRKDFDQFNNEMLSNLLKNVELRQGITKEDAIETFLEYQDFMNAKYHMNGKQVIDFKLHEQKCYKAINILLYGIGVEKKKEE